MKKRIIRILSVIIMLALLLPTLVPFAEAASGKYYTDINDSTEVGAAVNYLYEHGIMQGPIQTVGLEGRTRGSMIRTNMFYPNRSVSKMELILALWNMVENPECYASIKVADGFRGVLLPEVKESYRMAIRWAVDNKIIDKAADGIYDPDGALTTEQVVTILYRFVNYCGYDTAANTSSVRKLPITSLQTSRETLNALRWAISCYMIDANSNMRKDCARGEVAVYIHKIYQIYQKKYALSLARYDSVTSYLNRPATYDKLDDQLARVKAFFEFFGATAYVHRNVVPDNYVPGAAQIRLSDIMDQAFGNAKKLDICYLDLNAHGNRDGGIGGDGSGVISLYDIKGLGLLSATELRTYIDRYDGLFVVMINSCYSGSFIDTSRPFVKNLAGSHRIKVLCSAEATTPSGYMFEFWARGAGYDLFSERSTEEAGADVDCGNEDGRISLRELQAYIDREFAGDFFHPTCYPENDDTIIFERGY